MTILVVTKDDPMNIKVLNVGKRLHFSGNSVKLPNGVELKLENVIDLQVLQGDN